MRIVIFGPGAIGGIIAARLQQRGHKTILIARGQNRVALETAGLTLQTESMHWQSSVTVVDHPKELGLTSDDIMILAMKTQDTL